MHCIEFVPRAGERRAELRPPLAALLALSLAACSGPPASPTPTQPVAVAAAPVKEAAKAAPASAGTKAIALPAPRAMRNWVDVRRQAAERLVAANPAITYVGKVPDQLLAIPVLEIELNGDGSIRRIEILRPPRQAKDTLQIAIDSIRRAGPFGDVSRLPKPWKFVETFLFDEERKFKPRTLDN